jgi:hypothetical protein
MSKLLLRDLIQVPSDVSARLDAELRGRTDAGTLATALNGTGGGAYFSRQLEVVLAEVLKVPQSPMSGFELFPINTSLPEGADSYTQRVEDEYGEAQVGGNMADDPPTSDVTRSEFTMAIAPIKTGFYYSVQDIAAAIMTGMNLSQDRASAAMTADRRKHNDIMFDGHASVGLLGFHNHPSIPRVSKAARPTTAAEWEALINDSVDRVRIRTKTLGTGFTVLLPQSIFQVISKLNRGTGTDTTVLEYIRRNNPHIVAIREVYEQAGAGSGGTDLVSVAPLGPAFCEYRANLWRPLPVQIQNYVYKVPCLSRSGGMHIKLPVYAEHVEVPLT